MSTVTPEELAAQIAAASAEIRSFRRDVHAVDEHGAADTGWRPAAEQLADTAALLLDTLQAIQAADKAQRHPSVQEAIQDAILYRQALSLRGSDLEQVGLYRDAAAALGVDVEEVLTTAYRRQRTLEAIRGALEDAAEHFEDEHDAGEGAEHQSPVCGDYLEAAASIRRILADLSGK